MQQAIRTDKAPAPGGVYSQAIRAGGFVYTAGVGPLEPHTRQVVGTTIEDQTRQTLQNLAAILEAAGLSSRHVVKATVHLQDLMRDFEGMNRVYGEFFSEPYPVRTTVGSTLHGILVEIDLVACADA
ncbi:MAG: RidA family protein [Clostridia bacterium]